MPIIRIPVPLRHFTNGQAEVSVTGTTAGEAFAELAQAYPEIPEFLYDENGDFITSTYESVNVLLNKHDLRELQGPDTPVKHSDRLLILRTWPATISGGRQWNQPMGAEAPA